MPHPKAAALTPAYRDGVPGRAVSPPWEPASASARNLFTLPPAAFGGQLRYASSWAWAYSGDCVDVIGLDVVPTPPVLVRATLDRPGLCALLAFAGNEPPGYGEQSVSGMVGLTPQVVHEFSLGLPQGPYRIYAGAGNGLFQDGPVPILVFNCDREVIDIALEPESKLRFTALLSEAGHIAAAVIPPAGEGAHRIRTGWLSATEAVQHTVELDVALEPERYRLIVFAFGQPRPASA